MKSLLGNIRFYILLFSILLSFFFLYTSENTYTRAQINGITSIIFLYFTLLAGPVARVFPKLPYRGTYLKARRALGVSTFYFALLHFLSTIDYQGGLDVVLSLIPQAPFPLLAGLISLIILTIMAFTATDTAMRKMTFPKWKFLHRFVYLVEVLVIIHFMMIGSHFANRSGMLFYGAVIAIIILVSVQVTAFIQHRRRMSLPQSQM